LIICSSNAEKKNIYKLIKKNNIVFLPHGIKKNLTDFNKKFFKGKKKRALFFSRIHKKKGLIELTSIWCKIKPENCREWGLNFTYDKVGKMYEEYFTSLLNIHGKNGWYEPNSERNELDWLERQYPIY
jgi:hypothetical protein